MYKIIAIENNSMQKETIITELYNKTIRNLFKSVSYIDLTIQMILIKY